MPLPLFVSDLLSLIPLSAQTILEVGCGEGGLAAAYRRMNPKTRLLGIEKNLDAAALAALHLEQVSAVDVEADPLPFAAPDGIDCIVYNGVLRHLRDPWAVIRRQADALNLDGVLLLRLPNIEYWRLTDRRLRGVWDDGEGVVRGFSIAAIEEQICRAGLTLCDIRRQEPDGGSAKAFFDGLAPGLAAIGIDPDEYSKASHRQPSDLPGS
jgi:SAM-dependent methyltransferase